MKLGNIAMDRISGFKGVATCRLEYLNGCIRWQITPQELHDGEPVEAHYFDDEQLALALMIPRDEEFDVFVCEGALVEVWRGERLSVAQQFGTDWDGPVQSVLHAAAFCPPPAAPASAADPAPSAPWRCPREIGICIAIDARARRVV
jgi:hypothetical protein